MSPPERYKNSHMFTLQGKTAVVTGAGRGIGRAIAETLAEYGAQVLVNDLDAAPAAETENAIRQAGGKAASLAGDITDPALPQRLVDAAVERFGSLDIVVNNAGYTWDSVIQKMTDEQFQTMLNIHLVAPFRILRAASGWIRETAKREAADGRRVMRKVVTVTSIAGTDGNAGQAAYASGKAGVVGLTKTLAKEWGRYNVNVNAVGFGIIETRLVQPITAEERGVHRSAGAENSGGGAAENPGMGQERLPAGQAGNAAGGRWSGAVPVLAAIGLRYRRGADLQRWAALLTPARGWWARPYAAVCARARSPLSAGGDLIGHVRAGAPELSSEALLGSGPDDVAILVHQAHRGDGFVAPFGRTVRIRSHRSSDPHIARATYWWISCCPHWRAH